MGSPFYVEIYDPNKIRVEGSRTGAVAQLMDFESKRILPWREHCRVVCCVQSFSSE